MTTMNKKETLGRLICVILVTLLVTIAVLCKMAAENSNQQENNKMISDLIEESLSKFNIFSETIVQASFLREEDKKNLEESYQKLVSYFGMTQDLTIEITDLYNQAMSAIVCSKTNRYFNSLAVKYEEYGTKLALVQSQFDQYRELYNSYVQKLEAIPAYAISIIEKKTQEFEEEILPNYEIASKEEQKLLAEMEQMESYYTQAKQLADSLYEEYHPLMSRMVNAEGGGCSREEQACIANVAENRVASPDFKQNTLYDIIYAPGPQYACVPNGAINKIPTPTVEKNMEDYLRGRIETGMPDNVVYQAKFKQGSGIWKYFESSGHYYCYH